MRRVMEGASSGGPEKGPESGAVKVVEWEVFQDVLAQMCGRRLALKKALVDREVFSQQMEAALALRKVALEREDALEAMQRQVDAKKLRLKSAQEALRDHGDDLARKTEFIVPATRALQVAFKASADAQRRLQVAELLLSGEGGLERLRRLSYLLDARRRRMVAQLAFVYPLGSLKPEIPPTEGVEKEAVNKDGSSLIIAGMALSEPGMRPSAHSKDKSENNMSATALGYVGHVVTHLARYFDVQLRYPIRQMGSRSFVQDYCPAIEPAVDAVTVTVAPQYGSQKAVVEFPLFSEGQDTTRSAYAVFLLNKASSIQSLRYVNFRTNLMDICTEELRLDLEQILNHLGLESVGPRHTLLNLEKLLKGQAFEIN